MTPIRPYKGKCGGTAVRESPTPAKRAWGTLKNHTLEYVPPEKTNPKGRATGATSSLPPLS